MSSSRPRAGDGGAVGSSTTHEAALQYLLGGGAMGHRVVPGLGGRSATTTTSTRTTTTSSRKTASKKKGVACPENEPLVAVLRSHAEKVAMRPGGNSNYSFTVKRGIESISSHLEPITSHAQVLQLKYIGPHVASLLFPLGAVSSTTGTEDDAESSCVTKKRRRHASIRLASRGGIANSRGSSVVDSMDETQLILSQTSARSSTSANSAGTLATTAEAPKRKHQHVPPLRKLASISEGGQSTTIAERIEADVELPSIKEKAYRRAVQQAETWWNDRRTTRRLTWRVVLLIDGREPESLHIISKCQMSGIPCEERHLPIGDMTWIAQGCDSLTSSSSRRDHGPVVMEILLGTIIERKTCSDLRASLFGSRYVEQRLRLQHSGLPQVCFLIEGDTTKEQFMCPADTLHSAMMETRLYLNFSILQTANMTETVLLLKRMHRRVLQRAFPYAFRLEALPTFDEINADGARPQLPPPSSSNTSSTSATAMAQHRRHRRKRLQSLMELRFESDPLPPLGSNRFITYTELKTKVERDRELGTRTVGSVHAAMLKQVPTVSDTKVRAIARHYPTMCQLLQAYDDVPNGSHGDKERKEFLKDLSTIEPGQMSAREARLGERAATEMFIAFGMDVNDESSGDEQEVVRVGMQDDATMQRAFSPSGEESVNATKPRQTPHQGRYLEPSTQYSSLPQFGTRSTPESMALPTRGEVACATAAAAAAPSRAHDNDDALREEDWLWDDGGKSDGKPESTTTSSHRMSDSNGYTTHPESVAKTPALASKKVRGDRRKPKTLWKSCRETENISHNPVRVVTESLVAAANAATMKPVLTSSVLGTQRTLPSSATTSSLPRTHSSPRGTTNHDREKSGLSRTVRSMVPAAASLSRAKTPASASSMQMSSASSSSSEQTTKTIASAVVHHCQMRTGFNLSSSDSDEDDSNEWQPLAQRGASSVATAAAAGMPTNTTASDNNNNSKNNFVIEID